jgi:DNA repair protein RadD
MRLGPINYPTIPKQKKKDGGDPPVRECPECGTYNHISLKACEECGYEFPVSQKLNAQASDEELVIDFNSLPPPIAKEFETFRVHQMIAAVQPAKRGKWPTLRVDYFSGVRRFSTWVCPEHPGYPSMRAKEWWKAHGGVGPLPATAAELAEVFTRLKKPEYIKVWINTKYPEITAYDFLGTAFQLPPELGGPPLAKEVDDAAEARDKEWRERAAEMFEDDEIPF